MTPPASGAVLLIGAGRMGGALIKGWLAAKSFAAIHVIEPQISDGIRALADADAITLHAKFEAGRLPALVATVALPFEKPVSSLRPRMLRYSAPAKNVFCLNIVVHRPLSPKFCEGTA